MLIVENASTFESFTIFNKEKKLFSAIIFGNGNQITAQSKNIELLRKKLSCNEILYFGDIDKSGLGIALKLKKRQKQDRLQQIELYLEGYEFLLETDIMLDGKYSPYKLNNFVDIFSTHNTMHTCTLIKDIAWQGKRIPQEALTLEDLLNTF